MNISRPGTNERRPALRPMLALVAVIVLAAVFYQRASYNLRHIDYKNSNFVFFWLAGRMVLLGENPYDAAQWRAEQDANGVEWRPDVNFLYPLPLAVVLAPLGFLSLPDAYLAWQLLGEILIAISVWSLLRRASDERHRRMLVPIVLFLLFFGPVYLSLQIGALGPLTLAAILVGLAALEHDRPMLAGAALSLVLLKPPQGLPIILLAAVWMLSRREWKAIIGVGLGAAALFLIGILRDPLWPGKFATVGRALTDRSLGLQSNVFGFAYHACSARVQCMWPVGGAAAMAILGVGSLILWKRRGSLTAWDAFSVIIPTAFVGTLYLWSYDQILYIIPVVWIITRLVDKTRSYLAALVFLAVLVLVSFLALVNFANTRSDIWSALTTILVMAGLAAQHAATPPSSPVPAAS